MTAPPPEDDGRARFILKDGTEVARFFLSDNFVDIIQGPLGSGKTKACCARIMRHAQQQRPSRVDGIRKSRWAITRNVYPDLKRSTIRSWTEMVPEDLYGKLNWSQPPSHRVRFDDVSLEIDFLALDKPEDVSKLRSVEYTGVWFNEVQYSEKVLFDEATSRVGRYPSKAEGGTEWRGVIADANAPDEDHWIAYMTGQVDLPPGLTENEAQQYEWPRHWGFYKQPPALIETHDEHGRITGYAVNPAAENLEWLEDGYYERQQSGKPKSWIDSRLRNVVTLVVDGSPVWPMFRREFHVASKPLLPVPNHEVLVALDFGRVYPAALFMQELNDRIYVQYEMLGYNEGATIFAPKVKRFLEKHYAGHSFTLVGDPKGQDKGQATEKSAYDVFQNVFGVRPMAAPVKQNDIAQRIEVVAYTLNDNPSGYNRLVISPYCRTLIIGMAGRYHLVREEDGELRPKKDRYSNLCDCLQYGLLGKGEGRRMVGLKPTHLLRGVHVAPARRSMRRAS